MDVEEKVESYIKWGTGRAFVLAMNPIPMIDVWTLCLNESYMIRRIGKAYGYRMTIFVVGNFRECLGAGVGEMWRERFDPLHKFAIAAVITSAVGYSAAAWFRAGMSFSQAELREAYANIRGWTSNKPGNSSNGKKSNAGQEQQTGGTPNGSSTKA